MKAVPNDVADVVVALNSECVRMMTVLCIVWDRGVEAVAGVADVLGDRKAEVGADRGFEVHDAEGRVREADEQEIACGLVVGDGEDVPLPVARGEGVEGCAESGVDLCR